MEEEKKPASSSLKWMVLLTVIVGTFLGRLDQTIVNLALPKMIDDFGVSVSTAGWIATAYILANAIFVPVWGKLGDTIGRKKVYIIGFVVFIFGSVLAGCAWNFSSMIAFRVIQAIAGSADYPTAMAILSVTFTERKERAQALGIWSSAFAAASVFGPLIGGPLIDNFGWRSVFLVNLPVGIVGLLMAIKYIDESVSGRFDAKFDWWGAITLGGALAGVVLALDRGTDWGWLSSGLLITYAFTLICSYIFAKIEVGHPEPIIDFSFFKNSVFVNTLVNNFIVFMGMIGSMFLIPIFAETFLGYDATQTGYLFIPMAGALMLGAPIGGRLIDKVRPSYVIAASTFVAAIGLFMFTWLDPRSTAMDIIIPLCVMAFGLGFGMSQRTSIIAATVRPDEIGVASSILALVRNISGAFGIAIFGSLLDYFINNNIFTITKNSILNLTTSAQYSQAYGLISLKAQIGGYSSVFLVSAILVFVGAISAFFIKVESHQMGKHEVFVE